MVDNMRENFIKTSVVCYVCDDKEMFSFYTPTNGWQMFIGNSRTSKVVSLGKVVLKMTSDKEVTLNNVLQISDIRKNLECRALLSKKGLS